VWIFAREEHDIADHGKGCANSNEYVSPIGFPAQVVEEHYKNTANDVRRYRVQLLEDNSLFGVYCCNNCEVSESVFNQNRRKKKARWSLMSSALPLQNKKKDQRKRLLLSRCSQGKEYKLLRELLTSRSEESETLDRDIIEKED
jgi:hypothetical protein